MTTQKYRTHQGRTLDMGALILQNEKTRAVGNMGVNARGDRLDADNRPIDSRPNQVTRQYRRQITNVTDSPVRTTAPTTPAAPVAENTVLRTAPPPVEIATQPEAAKSAPEPTSIPPGGLAAAIARARSTGTQS